MGIKMNAVVIAPVLSLVALFLYVIGVFQMLTSNTTNDCDMTHMFEYPQYVRINVPENSKYKQYGLYAYSEGRLTENARKMRFDGVPVLFLPGNSGSYKQVRSLASVALTKAAFSQKFHFHFDYFSVDYNDELSGLFGGILMKQTEFARYCLKAIMKLYRDYQKPSSIIVIGHSMGGVIAKGLLNPETSPLISVILTLAAPLDSPVLNLDYYMNSYYDNVAKLWKQVILDEKVLISLGGGSSDLLVPPGLTSSPEVDVQALTTSIPGVWLPTDHLAILWCRELVLVLNKFLFSIVDAKTHQVTTDINKILHNANYYIKSRKRNSTSLFNKPVPMMVEKQWVEDTRRQYSIRFRGVTDTQYYMIRLLNLPNNQYLAVEYSNMENGEWLFGCSAADVHGSSRVCLSATPLWEQITWLSMEKQRGRKQVAAIDLHAIAAENPTWSHIIVKVFPTRKPVQLTVDIHGQSRFLTVGPKFMFSNFKQVILRSTEDSALRYEISFPGFDSLHQAYYLYVEPIDNCNQQKYHVSAKMYVPWAKGHEVHHHFSDTKKGMMTLRLFKEKPLGSTDNVTITLFLDESCKFKVSYSGSLYENAGQFTRHYTPSLIPVAAAIVIMAARSTLSSLFGHNGHQSTISYYTALRSNFMEIVLLNTLANIATMIIERSSTWSYSTIPSIGVMLILTQPFSSIVLPICQCLVAFGVVHLVAGAGHIAFLMFGQISHRFFIRLVWRGPGAKTIASLMRRIPGFAAAILTATIPASCGAVALTTGCFFYYFMLTKMYEDFVEEYFFKIVLRFAKRVFARFRSKSGDVPTTTEETRTELQNTTSEVVNKLEAIGDADKTLTTSELVVINKVMDSGINTAETTPTETTDAVAISSRSDTVEKAEVAPNTLSDTEIKNQPVKANADDDTGDVMCGLHFHFMMFIIWCVVTALNIPCLITWAHNFKYVTILESDPSFYSASVMLLSAGLLWQMERPRKALKYTHLLLSFLYAATILTLATGPAMLFCLNYILSTTFGVITLHQLFSKGSTTEHIQELAKPEDIPEPEEHPLQDFQDLKDKLESTEVEQ